MNITHTSSQSMNNLTIVLVNIRSSWNVGSIMRTCDALGASLILVGYTPRPIGKTLEMVKKTSIGAENTVQWEAYDSFQEVFIDHRDGLHVGIEIDETSSDIFEAFGTGNWDSKIKHEHVYLWFGNEISGLTPDIIQELDVEWHMPMNGIKESLNVATSVTAAGYLFYYHKFLINSTNYKPIED